MTRPLGRSLHVDITRLCVSTLLEGNDAGAQRRYLRLRITPERWLNMHIYLHGV